MTPVIKRGAGHRIHRALSSYCSSQPIPLPRLYLQIPSFPGAALSTSASSVYHPSRASGYHPYTGGAL